MTPSDEIPDLAEVDVPVGGRMMVVADLHLTRDPDPGELATAVELATNIEAATGPGVLVFAGNLLAGLAPGADPADVLSAHSRFVDAVARFAAGEGRRVIVLPGDHDIRLASSLPAQRTIRARLGAEMALAVELRISTGAGVRAVRVEPGYRFDRLSAYTDPRNPLDSPYAQHVRDDVLPSLRRRTGSGARWLSGAEHLDDVGALSRFIGSRLVYRRLVHSGWLIVVPIAVAIALRLPATALESARHGGLGTRLGLFVAAALVELLLLVLIGVMAVRVTTRALGAVALADPGCDPNEAPRAAARDLVTAGGTGLITGHTSRPELAHLGTGFYANAGCGAAVVTEYPSRLPGLGLPSVFLPHRILSWVELEAGNDLHVRLLHARQDLPGAALVERLVANRNVPSCGGELRPTVVATHPQGQAWPRPASTEARDRLVRRAAAAMLVAVGFLSLVSSTSDPLRDRLDVLRQLYPVAVTETAAAITAFFGVALIVLARGVRRGQRRAWAVCQLLLVAVAVLHLVKGVDVEEALIALGGAGLLWLFRSSFQARTDVMAMGRGLASVLVAAVLVVAAGTLGVEISTWIDHSLHRATVRLSWWHAL